MKNVTPEEAQQAIEQGALPFARTGICGGPTLRELAKLCTNKEGHLTGPRCDHDAAPADVIVEQTALGDFPPVI